jgi:hypothetical protein
MSLGGVTLPDITAAMGAKYYTNDFVAANNTLLNFYITGDFGSTFDISIDNVFVGEVTATQTVTAAKVARWEGMYNVAEQTIGEAKTQIITGAGGYQVITNWQQNVLDNLYSRTHSNITVNAAGRYSVSFFGSYATASASDCHAHLFTNGVSAVDATGNGISWRSSVITANNLYNSVSASGILIIPAGCKLDWRIDTAADETITWEDAVFRVEGR